MGNYVMVQSAWQSLYIALAILGSWMLPFWGQRVGLLTYRFEEHVDDAVEVGHVCCNQREDRLVHDHDEWASEVDGQDCAGGDSVLIGFGM